MDDEEQKADQNPSLPIALFVGVIMVICDILQLIPFVGDILDVVVGLPLDAYLWFSGINMTYALIAQVIEAIPALQELPLWTVEWIVTVYVAWHPKLEAIANVAGSVMEPGAGGVAGEAGALAKEAESVEQVGQEAKALEGAAQESAQVAGTAEKTGAQVTEGAEEATPAAKGASEETAEEKAKRTLKEKEQEGIESDVVGEESSSEEPGKEQVAEEVEKEKELDKELGEPEDIFEKEQEDLLGPEAAERIDVANRKKRDDEDETAAEEKRAASGPRAPSPVRQRSEPGGHEAAMYQKEPEISHDESSVFDKTPQLEPTASPEFAEESHNNEAAKPETSPNFAVPRDEAQHRDARPTIEPATPVPTPTPSHSNEGSRLGNSAVSSNESRGEETPTSSAPSRKTEETLQKDVELDKALGEQQAPLPELGEKLFNEVPGAPTPMPSSGSAEAQDVVKKSNVIQMPTPKQNESDASLGDTLKKTEEITERWEKERFEDDKAA